MEYKKINIITGHYGSGKTNICVNMALELAERGEQVTVVDLDIVNPYFRTADFEKLFSQHDVRLIAPMYANSNLDIPALNFDMTSIASSDGYIIIDVGGDDEGAKALGRYLPVFEKHDSQLLCVVNKYRYLTKEADEATELLADIERACGLRCAGIINNSNLGSDTDKTVIEHSFEYADEICRKTGLSLVATAGKAEFLENAPMPFPIKIFVRKIWEEFEQEQA